MIDDGTPDDLNRGHEFEVARLRAEVARLKYGATNSGFIQVSRKYLDELDALGRQSPTARSLLTTLVKAMDRKNAVVISQGLLAKRLNVSAPTVKRAVALLREQKWIGVKKVGTANVYMVNSAVFWTSRAEGKYATFSAQVVLDYDEQDEVTKAGGDEGLRFVERIDADEDVLVTGAGIGSDDPPEQAQIDFHRE
ncbi:helix-turn-helix domain-containing protein [Paraburkholderia hospita]|nr:helix-turn-helix domain-containing protein [Paraburkholderia hospita]